jgi:predicted Holliday junction resolvase-like endonuclease
VTAAEVALAAGFALAVVILVASRSRMVERRARQRFERWAAADGRRAVRRGVDGHRAVIKQQLGLDLGPGLTTLPFEPADIRFLGHPAHFVAFDGHTEVKDGRRDELAEVVFVTVRPDRGWDRASDREPEGALADAALIDAALIEECLTAGRVRWSTLRPDAAGGDGAGRGAQTELRAGDAG